LRSFIVARKENQEFETFGIVCVAIRCREWRHNFLERIAGPIIEYRASTAEEFWELLSPQKYLFTPESEPIFRGQSNAAWTLEPSILRGKNHPIYSRRNKNRPGPEDAYFQISSEIDALNTFASFCDSSGLKIPGDSLKFRREHLDSRNSITKFMYGEPWPLVEYFEIMALAQHHGLPTRLLDWSRSAHVAAYFAASGSLFENCENEAERLAVWALDIMYSISSVVIIRVPGGNNANVAAQGGLFTLLRQLFTMAQPFEGDHRLDGHMRILDSQFNGMRARGSQVLAKVTLPSNEAPKVIDLCKRHGITAATLQPDFYGAAKATREYLKCWSMSKYWDGRDIHIESLPAYVDPVTQDN
jgi:hypothetical protein